MLIAAFGAAWGSYAMQNAWLGLLVGIACGVLYSLIFAVLCVTFAMNQVICAIGMNMFAVGFTLSLIHIYHRQGRLDHRGPVFGRHQKLPGLRQERVHRLSLPHRLGHGPRARAPGIP